MEIASFLAKAKLKNFEDAMRYIKHLEYKRISDARDPLLVFKEKRGTCSSKHAALKLVAEHLGLNDIQLCLCLFKMNARNTPEIKNVLNISGIDHIPEAHSFLKREDRIIDITFPYKDNVLPLEDILSIRVVTVNQLINDKQRIHREYLKSWIDENKTEMSLNELWKIREACILALSNS